MLKNFLSIEFFVWVVVAGLAGTLMGWMFGHPFIGLFVGFGVLLLALVMLAVWAMSISWFLTAIFDSISGRKR